MDRLMRSGSSIFVIYERLRAEYPDILRLHHQAIENEYLKYKTECEKVSKPFKKRVHSEDSAPLLPPADLDD